MVGGYGDKNLRGSTWVFVRNNGVWTQEFTKLIGSGGSVNAAQGYSVAINAKGDRFITGAYNDNNAVGAAWIFSKVGTSWLQTGQKLVGTGYVGRSEQGVSVALSADGNTALIGGPYDNDGQGAVWVFTNTNGTWAQLGNKLTGTGNIGTALQGWSVAINADGTRAIIGGIKDDNFKGALWPLSRTGNTWAAGG